MSENQTQPKTDSEKDTRTDAEKKADDNVDSKMDSLVTAIESRSKTKGKSPEYVFALKVADSVKTMWKNGNLPTTDSFKGDIAGQIAKDVTAGTGLTLASKATVLSFISDQAEKHKASIKKKTPEISEEDLKSQVKDFVAGIYEVAGERKKAHEVEVKKRKEAAEAKKKSSESQSQSA